MTATYTPTSGPSSSCWERGCSGLSLTRVDDQLSKVAVAVVNWNDLASTMRCLASVSKASPESLLVMVDNGSDDGPQEAVQSEFPTAVVVRLETNRGYAGGCNAGA